MAACQNGHLKIVELLLSLSQVDVNAKDQVIYTCVYNIAWGFEIKLVTDRSQAGINAFMYAASTGKVEIAQTLLKHPDVDINERSDVCSWYILKIIEIFYTILQKGHCTALMFACYKGHMTCVELLLGHNADGNIRDYVSGWRVYIRLNK